MLHYPLWKQWKKTGKKEGRNHNKALIKEDGHTCDKLLTTTDNWSHAPKTTTTSGGTQPKMNYQETKN